MARATRGSRVVRCNGDRAWTYGTFGDGVWPEASILNMLTMAECDCGVQRRALTPGHSRRDHFDESISGEAIMPKNFLIASLAGALALALVSEPGALPPGESESNIKDIQERLMSKLHDVASQPEAAGKVTVALGFLHDVGVPMTTRVYVPSEEAELWDEGIMLSTDLDQNPLIGQPVGPSELPWVEVEGTRAYYAFMEPGDEALLTLSVVNETDEDVHFIAGPAQFLPHDLYHFVVANCYCNGISHEAPANGQWARVIRISLRDYVPAGAVGLALFPVTEREVGGPPHEHEMLTPRQKP